MTSWSCCIESSNLHQFIMINLRVFQNSWVLGRNQEEPVALDPRRVNIVHIYQKVEIFLDKLLVPRNRDANLDELSRQQHVTFG